MDMLVLGATGRVAQSAVPLLARQEESGRITMAGRDLAAVDARRAELGVDAITVQVDATDEAQVADAALNCDLVLNLAGLDHATPISGARGALAAGCQYVDIGASATAVLTLLGWTDEFEAAGLACLPSIGLCLER